MTAQPQTSHDRSVRVLPIEPDGELELRLSTHELRLRAVDGDQVVIRSRDGDDLERHLEIQTGAGFVRIIGGPAGSFRIGPLEIRKEHAPDLEVDVPRGVRVTARTVSGDMTAHGLRGASNWTTATGDLRLGLEGGPVVVETMSGDCRIESGTELDVTARSVSGDVRVRAPRLTAVQATTTSGDIEVSAALMEGGRHLLTSVSGDIRLLTGSEVRIEAESVAGDLRATVPHKAEGGRGRRVVTVGAGRVLVRVRTMSGDVTLRPGVSDAASPGAGASAAAAARPAPVDHAATDPDAEQRLEILRRLERGEIDIEAASEQLASLDGAAAEA